MQSVSCRHVSIGLMYPQPLSKLATFTHIFFTRGAAHFPAADLWIMVGQAGEGLLRKKLLTLTFATDERQIKARVRLWNLFDWL